MPIDSRLSTILAKAEVTYGTDPTPTVAANAMMPRSFDANSPKINEIEMPRVDAKHRTVGKQIGSVSIPIKAEFECVGRTDSPLTAPQFSPFLLACGMTVAGTGGPPVDTQTYIFSSLAVQPAVTIYEFRFSQGGAAEALTHEYNGCRFAWEINGAVDAPCVIAFNGEGLWGGVSDATPTVASLAFDDEVVDGANGKACTFTIGGVSTDIKSFGIKSGREVMRRDSILGTYGVKEIFVTAKPGFVNEITLDREVQLVATRNHWSRMLASGTKYAWSLSWTSADGSTVTISGSKLQEGSFSYEDDGILRLKQKFYACDSADTGDDAITITFT